MKRSTGKYVLPYALVSFWSLLIILPLVWMALASFKTKREIFIDPLGLPARFSLDNFVRAWDVGIGMFMLNSVIAVGLSVLVIVMLSAMAAYVLARSESRLAKLVYLLVVACFAVPLTAVLVPLYQMLSAAGLLNSQLAIVLPYSAYGIPFTTMLFYAFFLDFPKELEEAARLDGCNQFQIFFRIIMPLSGPVVASAAIFQAVFGWNEFLLASLVLTNSDVKTLPVGIMQLKGEYASDWPAVMAGLSLATIPMLLIFILAQKYFVRSLAGLGK